MTQLTQNIDNEQGKIYEVRIQGKLEGEHWTRYFDGMTVSFNQRGNTLLRGSSWIRRRYTAC